MPTETPHDDRYTPDEDTPAGMRIRVRSLEKSVNDLHRKVDRLTWAVLSSALALCVSILAATYG